MQDQLLYTANDIPGGHHSYATYAEMEAIPAELRRPDMEVTVYADPIPSNNKTYKLGTDQAIFSVNVPVVALLPGQNIHIDANNRISSVTDTVTISERELCLKLLFGNAQVNTTYLIPHYNLQGIQGRVSNTRELLIQGKNVTDGGGFDATMATVVPEYVLVTAASESALYLHASSKTYYADELLIGPSTSIYDGDFEVYTTYSQDFSTVVSNGDGTYTFAVVTSDPANNPPITPTALAPLYANPSDYAVVHYVRNAAGQNMSYYSMIISVDPVANTITAALPASLANASNWYVDVVKLSPIYSLKVIQRTDTANNVMCNFDWRYQQWKRIKTTSSQTAYGFQYGPYAANDYRIDLDVADTTDGSTPGVLVRDGQDYVMLPTFFNSYNNTIETKAQNVYLLADTGSETDGVVIATNGGGIRNVTIRNATNVVLYTSYNIDMQSASNMLMVNCNNVTTTSEVGGFLYSTNYLTAFSQLQVNLQFCSYITFQNSVSGSAFIRCAQTTFAGTYTQCTVKDASKLIYLGSLFNQVLLNATGLHTESIAVATENPANSGVFVFPLGVNVLQVYKNVDSIIVSKGMSNIQIQPYTDTPINVQVYTRAEAVTKGGNCMVGPVHETITMTLKYGHYIKAQPVVDTSGTPITYLLITERFVY